jgi:hypothetical protein
MTLTRKVLRIRQDGSVDVLPCPPGHAPAANRREYLVQLAADLSALVTTLRDSGSPQQIATAEALRGLALRAMHFANSNHCFR